MCHDDDIFTHGNLILNYNKIEPIILVKLDISINCAKVPVKRRALILIQRIKHVIIFFNWKVNVLHVRHEIKHVLYFLNFYRLILINLYSTYPHQCNAVSLRLQFVHEPVEYPVIPVTLQGLL